MIRLTPLTAFSIVVLCLVADQQMAHGQGRDFDMGMSMVTHNRLRECVPCFDRDIAAHPNHADAYMWRAKAKLELEDLKGGYADLNKAIELKPNSSELYDMRARARWELQDKKGAMDDIDKAIKLKPKDDSLYRMRAKLHQAQGNYDKALVDLNKAVSVATRFAQSNYRLRGDVYFRMKRYELALADYTKSIENARSGQDNDELEKLYSQRALTYEKLGKIELAKKDRAKVHGMLDDGWGAFLNTGGK